MKKAPQRPSLSEAQQNAARALVRAQKNVLDSLGYTHRRPPLYAELVAAGFVPMDQEQVQRYKASKAGTTFPWYKVGYLVPTAILLLVTALNLAFHNLINTGPLALNPYLVFWSWPAIMFNISVASAALLCYTRAETPWITYIRKEWYWEAKELASYGGVASVRAWETVEALRQAQIPDLSFQIETLKLRQCEEDINRGARRKAWERAGGFLDPFLVVSRGNERYYLEVWDEPGFMNYA